MTVTIRKPLRRAAVAGYCYPSAPDALREVLRRTVPNVADRVGARGVIVPHASFRQSGMIAGDTFGRLVVPRRCVILGPNHTGLGSSWSLMPEGAYQTPLGEVPVDEELAGALLEACPFIVPDESAHKGEHAIEVQLPFLQWCGPEDVSIVPIVMDSDNEEQFAQAAEALADLVRRSEEPVLLVASSDLTHYEPRAVVAQKDAQALEAIQALDVPRFLQCIRELKLVMCGYGAIACVLGAAKHLGARGGRVVRYATSADAGSDPNAAIGYAGVILN